MQLVHLFNIISIISVSALAAPSPDVVLYKDHVESLETRAFKKTYRQSCKVSNQDGYWVAPATIGGKTKKCKVSTAAADVLVFDNSFSSSVRGSAGLGGFLGGFLGGLKGSLSTVGGASWGFNFGGGLELGGSIYKFIVACGGLAVQAMQFGCLDKKAEIPGGLDFHGVLGLGFKGVSSSKCADIPINHRICSDIPQSSRMLKAPSLIKLR